MKRLISFVILSLIVVTAKTQTYRTHRGMRGYMTSVVASNLHTFKLRGFAAVRLIQSWSDLEPAKGDFSALAGLKSSIKQCNDSGFDVHLQILSNESSPISWLSGVDGVGTYVTSSGSIPGPYPDVYSANYKADLLDFHKHLSDSLKAWNLQVYAFTAGWGTTGDVGPNKGTCGTDACLGITYDDTWVQWIKDMDVVIYSDYAGTSIRPAFNPDNTGKLLDYLATTYPDAIFKHGEPSHSYMNEGEKDLPYWPLKDYYGEVQNAITNSTHKQDPLILVAGALASNLTALDVSYAVANGFFGDTRITNFFVGHCADRFDFKRGFIYFADPVSYDDLDRFTEAAYGVLIDPTQVNHDRTITNINNTADNEYYKQSRRLNATENDVNTTRINNINTAGTGAGINSNYFLNDVMYSGLINYGLNMTQQVPFTTTTGVYRTSPDTSIYGRMARQGDFYIDIDDRLSYNTLSGNNVTINVYYLDAGVATWKVSYAAGCRKATAFTMTNTNTNSWKIATFSISNFCFGNKLKHGSDLILEKSSGAYFPVQMIEIVNNSKP